MPVTLARRNELAQARGWRSYGERRTWERRLDDPAEVRRLADVICGSRPTRSRPGSLMCASCNARVNPRGQDRPGSWKARLVHEARVTRKRRLAARKGWATRRRNRRP